MGHRPATARLHRQTRPHSFRLLVVTDLLAQHLPLEDVQYLAGGALEPADDAALRSVRRRVTAEHRRTHLGVERMATKILARRAEDLGYKRSSRSRTQRKFRLGEK